MRNVYDIAYELAAALKESSEFKRFKAAKEKVEKDEKLKQMISDFKKKQFELEQKRLKGEEVTSSDVYSLQQLYQIISLNPDIEEYLSAEMMLAKIIADISKIIADSIELKDEIWGFSENK